jgi:hypothetical protein
MGDWYKVINEDQFIVFHLTDRKRPQKRMAGLLWRCLNRRLPVAIWKQSIDFIDNQG